MKNKTEKLKTYKTEKTTHNRTKNKPKQNKKSTVQTGTKSKHNPTKTKF